MELKAINQAINQSILVPSVSLHRPTLAILKLNDRLRVIKEIIQLTATLLPGHISHQSQRRNYKLPRPTSIFIFGMYNMNMNMNYDHDQEDGHES